MSYTWLKSPLTISWWPEKSKSIRSCTEETWIVDDWAIDQCKTNFCAVNCNTNIDQSANIITAWFFHLHPQLPTEWNRVSYALIKYILKPMNISFHMRFLNQSNGDLFTWRNSKHLVWFPVRSAALHWMSDSYSSLCLSAGGYHMYADQEKKNIYQSIQKWRGSGSKYRTNTTKHSICKKW